MYYMQFFYNPITRDIINFIFDQNHQIPLKVIDVYKLLSPRPEKPTKVSRQKGGI